MTCSEAQEVFVVGWVYVSEKRGEGCGWLVGGWLVVGGDSGVPLSVE